MRQFTLEFLPHFSGGLVRKADFSLYEIKWNNYGVWGFFEFQINLPNDIFFHRKSEDERTTIGCDVTIRDSSGKWPFKRLHLYESHRNEILTSIPEPYFLNVTEHLVLILLLSFNYSERKQIAEQFRFRFPDENLKKIYFSEISISDLLHKFKQHISIR